MCLMPNSLTFWSYHVYLNNRGERMHIHLSSLYNIYRWPFHACKHKRVEAGIFFFLLMSAHRSPQWARRTQGLPVPHWKSLPQSSSGSRQDSLGSHCRLSPTACTHFCPLNCPKTSMFLERNWTKPGGNIRISNARRDSNLKLHPQHCSLLRPDESMALWWWKVTNASEVTSGILGIAVSPIESGSSRHSIRSVCHIQIYKQGEPLPFRYLSLLLSWGASYVLVLFLELLATQFTFGDISRENDNEHLPFVWGKGHILTTRSRSSFCSLSEVVSHSLVRSLGQN